MLIQKTLFALTCATLFATDISYGKETELKGEHLTVYGLPEVAKVIRRDEYILAYDGHNKTAFYVLEEITKGEMKAKEYSREEAEKGCSVSGCWQPDPEVPEYLTATNADYKGSGYHRGHLAPRSDFRYNLTKARDTFYYSNCAPQASWFNREIWRSLEIQVREWATKFGSLFVVTGPAFAATKDQVKYPTIGTNKVGVPTHYYKAVLRKKGKEAFEICCFFMPNIEKYPKTADFRDPKYTISLLDLEKATGIVFFPKIDRSQITDIDPKLWDSEIAALAVAQDTTKQNTELPQAQ